MPSWLDVFIIEERRDDWKQPTAPCLLRDTTEGQVAAHMEEGSPDGSMREKKQAPLAHESPRTDSDNGHGMRQRDSSSSATVDPQSDNPVKQI